MRMRIFILVSVATLLLATWVYAFGLRVYWPPSRESAFQWAKIIVDYKVEVGHGARPLLGTNEVEFVLTIKDNPDNKDGLLWATSVSSVGVVDIRDGKQLIATVWLYGRDADPWADSISFRFSVDRKYLPESTFTFMSYPVPKDLQDRWLRAIAVRASDHATQRPESMNDAQFCFGLQKMVDATRKTNEANQSAQATAPNVADPGR